MALLRIPRTGETISEPDAIALRLSAAGIGHERWTPSHPLPPEAPSGQVLDAYGEEIERLKRTFGYVAADVIDVGPATAGLEAMLEKFRAEHWHDEDEVRFILEGRGLFHVRPAAGDVVAIQVEPGDLIRLPRATLHWFDLCPDRRIRAIRLFQDPAGWTPRYTASGAERGFEPVCLGPEQIAGGASAR